MPSPDGVRISPDPLLSANIYGLPDDVLARVVLPFWKELCHSDGVDSFLWPLRYACGGEHLKIRIHAPPHRREEISDRLSVITNNAHLAPADKSASSRAAVPMDPEDSLSERDITRSSLWTRYQRSPLVFGSDPLPWDDTYAAKLTACLGQAWNFALPLFEPGRETHIPYRRRVTALLRLVASGLQAALPSPDQRAKYILYHRDWIIRFHSLRSGKGQEKAQKLLDMFDHKLSQAGAISQEIFGCLTDICSTP